MPKKEKKPKKIRAAIYSRVSTQAQIDRTEYDSMQSHLDRCKHYILAQENWELEKIYEDPAESGDKWGRKDFQDMLYDVRNDEIDVIVAIKLDRFSRIVGDFHKILEIFENNDVNLVSVTQGFDTGTAAGKLLRNILIDFAQFERDINSERTKEKRIMRAKKGLWNGGTVPFGYKSVDKKLVINETEARIVREIFEKFLDTRSVTKVRDNLDIKGYKTKNGKKWGKTTIHSMLQRPVYAGKLFEGGEYYDGIHEAIIDPDRFFAIQNIAKVDYRSTKRSDRLFMLKGLVKCGNHACAMTPYSVKKKNGDRYYYYFCTHKNNHRKVNCSTAYANADDLEKYVIERLRQIATQDEDFKEIVSGVNMESKKQKNPYKEELSDVEARIKEIESEIDNFLEFIASSGKKAITELIESKIEKSQKNLEALKNRRGELKLMIASSPQQADAELILKTLKDFSKFYDKSLPAERMAFLQRLIKEIIVSENNILLKIHSLPDIPFVNQQLDLSNKVAPQHGLEPRTQWLTALFSTD